MIRHRLLLLLCLLTALASAVTLTRCGSGVGPGHDAAANGMKF